MKAIMLISGALVAGLVSVSSGEVEQLRYWGKHPGATTGLIERGRGEYFVIEVGTEIPSWGLVKEVGDSDLVVEQVLTEAQKHRLRERGAMPYDVLQVHIPREDLRHPQSLPHPPR